MKDHVRLYKPDKSGACLAEHLRQVEKTTGERPVELDASEPPGNLCYIWECFWDLHSGRGAGMSGPLPISWLDIKAWCDLHRRELDSFELGAIRGMDNAFLEAVNGHSKSGH